MSITMARLPKRARHSSCSTLRVTTSTSANRQWFQAFRIRSDSITEIIKPNCLQSFRQHVVCLLLIWHSFEYVLSILLNWNNQARERFKPFPCFLQKSYGSADGKISWNRQATIIRVNPQTMPTGRGEIVWIKSGLYLRMVSSIKAFRMTYASGFLASCKSIVS